MADVDIDPFGEHDKTDSHSDETAKIFLSLGGGGGGGSDWKIYLGTRLRAKNVVWRRENSVNQTQRIVC